MAKEVKDLTSKEVSKSEVLPVQNSDLDLMAGCDCSKATDTSWYKLDDKLTDVKLELLAKLQDGLTNGAGIEYLMQLSCIYNNIR